MGPRKRKKVDGRKRIVSEGGKRNNTRIKKKGEREVEVEDKRRRRILMRI